MPLKPELGRPSLTTHDLCDHFSLTYVNGAHHVKGKGDKSWWYKGHLHRENDLPAIIYANGDKYWWYNGKEHRENNLPTFICGKERLVIYSNG